MINLLYDKTNQPSKSRTRNLVEINGESRGAYNENIQIKCQTLMIRSNLWDYGDAYIIVSGAITVTVEGHGDAAEPLDEINKGVISKNYAPFTYITCITCISNRNNTKIDNAKDINVVMPMYNLIE